MSEHDKSDAGTYGIEEEQAAKTENATVNCSNCGAPMPEGGSQICVGCGFDARKGEVTGTKTGIADVPAEPPAGEIVSSSGIKAWLILALVAIVILAVAWLAGWSSLFLRSDGKYLASSGDYTLDSPGFIDRILGVIRWVIAGLTLTLVGCLALRFTAMIASRSAGTWLSVSSRLAMIVAASGLATLIPIDSMWLERIVQLVVGAGLATLGSFLILRLRGAQLGIFLASWVLLLAALLPVARLIAWSFGA